MFVFLSYEKVALFWFAPCKITFSHYASFLIFPFARKIAKYSAIVFLATSQSKNLMTLNEFIIILSSMPIAKIIYLQASLILLQ